MIDLDIENELRPNLSDNEKLIWTGRPKTGIKLRRRDILLIPYSLLWGGFVMYGGVRGIHSVPDFSIIGIPLVLVGLYFIIGRFFIDAYIRSKTIYGITKSRVIIETKWLGRSIKSMNIKNIPDISLSQNRDGSGIIRLDYGSAVPGIPWNITDSQFFHRQAFSLYMIEDVGTVYDMIIELYEKSYETK